MRISIREALLNRDDVLNYKAPKSDNWILIKPAADSDWTPEAKSLKAYSSSGDYITTDYEIRVYDEDNVKIIKGDSFSGTGACDYWFCELPDGATIMMMTGSHILRDNLEAIQELVVEAYDPNDFRFKNVKFK